MANALHKTALWLAATAAAVNGQLFAQDVGEWPHAQATDVASTVEQSLFSVAQVEQMVAPVALYPDALLAQVLMAATYPVEVAQADQWLKRNRRLQGEALDRAVAAQSWDPSVKTLVFFPSVLERMAQDLAWTQDLGDAFLSQEADVMAAVQRLRRQAQQAGNLASNTQQVVRNRGSTIVIEPADPTVIYVPTYNPVKVYGSAWVPGTVYYPNTYAYVSSTPSWVAFGAGVLVGAVLTAAIDWADDDYYVVYPRYRRHYHPHIHQVWYGYWGPEWKGPRYGGSSWKGYRPVYVNRGDVYIDNSRTINVERTQVQASYPKREWRHDPSHRRISYRDPEVAKRFVGSDRTPRGDRDAARRPDPVRAQPDRERPGAPDPDRAHFSRGGAPGPDRGDARRLDRGEPPAAPADRATREALRGDERVRRDRILGGTGEGASPAERGWNRDQLPRRGPASETVQTPSGSAGERGRDVPRRQAQREEARTMPQGTEPPQTPQDPGRRRPPRAAEAAPSPVEPQGSVPDAPPAQTPPRGEAQPSVPQAGEPRPLPQDTQPPETPRRADRRQMPQSAEPQQVPRQWQPRAEARPVPQSAEPQQMPRQRQPSAEARQLPQDVQPRETPPRAEPRPVPQSAEPQQMPRQRQPRAEVRQLPQDVQPRETPRRAEPRPVPQSAEPRQMPRQWQPRAEARQVPQNVQPRAAQAPRERPDGPRGGQQRPRQRDQAAPSSP